MVSPSLNLHSQNEQECIPVGHILVAALVVSPAMYVPHQAQPPGMHAPTPFAMYAPSPVDRMTDTCENITFPQLLLRTVKSTVCWSLPSPKI